MAQAFPTTPVIENGSGADENPLSAGGLFTQISGVGPMKRASGVIRAHADWGGVYCASAAAAEAYFTVTSYDGNHYVWLRLHDAHGNNPIQEAHRQGYRFGFSSSGYHCLAYTDAVPTTMIPVTGWPASFWSNGVAVGARIIGSTMEVWAKKAGDSWQRFENHTDYSWAAPGAIGYQLENTLSSIDDLGGGAFAAEPPPIRFGPTALPGTATLLLDTVVGRVVIESIHVSNPSGNVGNLTMSLGLDAAGTRLFDDYPIPADSERRFRFHMPLEVGEIIQGFSTGATLVVTIDGRQV